jgi:hypothetical protein
MNIYTISVFEGLDEKHGIAGSLRCFGYSKDFKYADESIRNNVTDLNETIYDYAVIEKVEEGLNPIAWDRWFYKYDRKKDIYEPIEEPEILKKYHNFVIG